MDLMAGISSAAASLETQLHPRTCASLAELVRMMNCYYSNLIEGHNTRPREIEAAPQAHASEAEGRNVRLEALAHVRVQCEIDRRYREGSLGEPADLSFLQWVHRDFYEGAPEDLLRVDKANPQFRMNPGELRKSYEVAVGLHRPPSSDHAA